MARVHGRARGGGREEDRSNQESPRHHRTRPQGSKGPRRGRDQAGQGRREQGRSREGQGSAGEGWRQGGIEVSKLLQFPPRTSEAEAERPGIAQGLERGDGGARSTFYTKMCGDWQGYPSNL